MNYKKALVAVGVSAALGVSANNASALTLTFANNPGTIADYGGTFTSIDLAGNAEFTANSEFRVVAFGTSTNDGHKDVFSGGETWTFTGSDLTATYSTANAGAAGQAPVTVGEAGYPLCAANSCNVIQNGAPFVNGQIFTMAIPTMGDALASATDNQMPTANAIGHATIDTSGLSATPLAGETFMVHTPVLYTQWSGGTYVIGHGGGGAAPLDWSAPTGVDFTFTMLDSNNFIMRGVYQMTRGEVTIAGFNANYTEWEAFGCLDGTCANPIPVPAAVWLMGSGLVGLVGVARRRRKAV